MTGGDRTLRVRAGGGARDYDVVVGRGALGRLPSLLDGADVRAHRWAVVTDSNVGPLHGDRVASRLREDGREVDVFSFPAGERSKSRRVWADLLDRMLGSGLGRDSVVVAVGGGVVGDLAGFVAATFMRGVPVVQVPTSLVAMIDASVGGKTGVDTPAGKNLVGAFHPPALVVADPDTVATLPRPERAQGLAEAVKHGAILDAGYLEVLENDVEALLDAEPDAVLRAVVRSVEIKADVVGRDEREAGLRQILNFGHTLGHALEAASRFHLPHGSAVAAGMVLEARLGEALAVTEAGTAERLASLARRLELPHGLPAGLAASDVVRRTRTDKKARGGRARYVLLGEAGRVARSGDWTREVPDEAVTAVLQTSGRPGGPDS